MKFTLNAVLFFLAVILFTSCKEKEEVKNVVDGRLKINFDHLNSLFEEIEINGEKVGIVHIYSEAPEYGWIGDEDEGIACVDDAARAGIAYLRHYDLTGDNKSFERAKLLIRFVLEMQSPDGYFYNFIWPDHSIHTEGITTKAIPAWWSWRALWMMGEALDVLEPSDELTQSIVYSRDKLVRKVLQDEWWKNTKIDTAGGFDIPTWLPDSGAGADQAGILLTGLSLQYKQSAQSLTSIASDSIKTLMVKMADGIMMMQVIDPGQRYDGVMLSWNNLWHSYGNIQSYALLLAGSQLKDTSMTKSALYEVDNFVTKMVIEGPFNHFYLRKTEKGIQEIDLKVFPQIFYGLRPVIWSSLKAAEVTGDEKYKRNAEGLSKWIEGRNPVAKKVYDETTGRAYDGILSTNEINMNSGAESTIECLLILLELEKADRN